MTVARICLRRWVVLLLSFCLGILGGCQPKDEGRVLNFWALGSEGEAAGEMLAEFERQTPGVRVRVQQIPWSAAHEKLLTAYAAGNLPDVIQLGNTWIAEFAALRALEDIGARLDGAGRKDDFFAGTLDASGIDGRVWAVPWYVDTRLMFYRRDLLAKAGYPDPPKTWAAWVQCMRRLRDAGHRFAAFVPLNEWQLPVILGLQRGAGLLRDGDRYGDFLHPDFAAAMDFYLGLFRDGLAPAATAAQLGNVYLEFERGAFATWITGPWNLGEFRRRLSGLPASNWDTAPMPSFDGRYPGLSLAGGASLAISASSRHKNLAWKLVEYLTAPRQQVRLYRLTGDLPPGKNAWTDPLFERDGQVQAFRQQMERLISPPKIPEWERIASRFTVYTEKMVRGEMADRAALETLNREVDDMLEKRRWLLEHGR